jgi:hypothetical protein
VATMPQASGQSSGQIVFFFNMRLLNRDLKEDITRRGELVPASNSHPRSHRSLVI